MDLSKLSDKELDALEAQHSGPDLSQLSDEELDELDRDPSTAESALHGAIDSASLGFIDELSGAGEALGRAIGVKGLGGKFSDVGFQKPTWGKDFEKDYAEGRDKKRALHAKLKSANPDSYLGGEIAGGLTSALIPGLGAAKGLRGAVGAGAALGAGSGLGHSEAEDAAGMGLDTLIGTGIGAGLGAGGYGIAKGAEKSANYVAEKLAPAISKMLPVGKKANAAEIEAAAKALGVEATPGMTNASERVQGLESSLHQAPTIGGWLTRRGTEPVTKGMQKATGELIEDAASVSPFESGENVKKIIAKEVEGKFKPSTEIFDELRGYTKDIHANPASVNRVGKNIMNIPEVKTLELPLAKQIVKRLGENPSVDEIKMLRTMVGAEAKASQGAQKSAYWQLYAKLGRLEENTLKRGVIQSARTKGEGDTIAKGMLGQLKSAKKGYAEQMGNLEDLSQAARLGRVSDGPSGFVDKIDSIPSERLQEKLLPLEDVRLAKMMQDQFPEAFGGLRKARIRDLAEGVEKDGSLLPGKFLQSTKDLNPEAQSMLFGDKSGTLNSLRTVNEALPAKVGPSGTSQALDFKEMLNPVTQGRDLMRYGAYKAASSETLNRVAQFLRSQPKFANMAEQNPKAFQAAVYEFANKVRPASAMPRAAQFNPQEHVDEDRAKQSFLEGN